MSENATAFRRPASASSALRAARILLAVLGAFVIGGSVYFGFVDTGGETDGVVDYALGVWALLNGLGFIVAAVLLDRGPRMLRLAAGLVVAHLVFSAIKILGYGEREVVVMVAADLAILALLYVGGRARGRDTGVR